MDARARRLPSLAEDELPRGTQEGEIALSERLRGLEREVAVDPIKSSDGSCLRSHIRLLLHPLNILGHLRNSPPD